MKSLFIILLSFTMQSLHAIVWSNGINIANAVDDVQVTLYDPICDVSSYLVTDEQTIKYSAVLYRSANTLYLSISPFTNLIQNQSLSFSSPITISSSVAANSNSISILSGNSPYIYILYIDTNGNLLGRLYNLEDDSLGIEQTLADVADAIDVFSFSIDDNSRSLLAVKTTTGNIYSYIGTGFTLGSATTLVSDNTASALSGAISNSTYGRSVVVVATTNNTIQCFVEEAATFGSAQEIGTTSVAAPLPQAGFFNSGIIQASYLATHQDNGLFLEEAIAIGGQIISPEIFASYQGVISIEGTSDARGFSPIDPIPHVVSPLGLNTTRFTLNTNGNKSAWILRGTDELGNTVLSQATASISLNALIPFSNRNQLGYDAISESRQAPGAFSSAISSVTGQVITSFADDIPFEVHAVSIVPGIGQGAGAHGRNRAYTSLIEEEIPIATISSAMGGNYVAQAWTHGGNLYVQAGNAALYATASP